MDAVTAVALGIAVGLVTGLLPGLHVNLLAALSLLLPLGNHAGLAIVAVGVVHTFVSILPATYLGMPDEGALSVLPAHRLRMEGSAREAVRISLHASMLAVLAMTALLLPYRLWLALPPVLPFLRLIAPALLLAVPVWLVVRARRRGAAALCAILAAGLGWLAFEWPVAGWLPGAATPLLPLLSGLFGVPTLLWSMRQDLPAPRSQEPAGTMPIGTHRAGLRGVAVASLTAVLPGLTAAVATSLALPGRDVEPRRVLATMSAVNTAHLCLALAVLWMTGQTRSGLAIAWTDRHDVLPWTVVPPPDLMAVLATCLIAGAAAVWATPLIEPTYERVLAKGRPGHAERWTFAMIVTLVAIVTGWPGLLLLAAATFVGCLPLRLGTARVHLAAALSVPIALKLAGL